MTRTDSIDCARRLFALAALALAVDAGHALEINADASFFDGNQYLDTAVTTTAQTTTAVSQADATNFAVARVDATTGAVGIGFGSTGTSGHFGANTVGVLNETWTCPVNVLCGTAVIVPVTYAVHLSGTLSADWLNPNSSDYYFFGGALDVGRDELSFQWDQASRALTGEFCDGAVCSAVAFASTVNSDGSISFNDNVGLPGFFSNAGGGSRLTMNGGWDSVSQPSFLSFLNTFSFDIVSNDPSFAWVSDSGRSSLGGAGNGGGGESSNTVAEPGTAALLGLAGVAAGWVRRRRSGRDRLT